MVEVGRSRADCFIFSSEHCHSRLVDENGVRRLHDLLAPLFDTIEVVAYLRRQDRVAVSFYSTYLRGGGTDAAIMPPPVADSYFDYAALLARWTKVFGSHVTMISYEQMPRDIVADFVARFKLPELGEEAATSVKLNRSIPGAAQEAIRHLNMVAPALPDPAVARARDALVIASRNGDSPAGRRPSRTSARAFAAKFERSNAEVEAAYLSGKRLFDDDFDDYPIEEGPIATSLITRVFADALIASERAKARLSAENAALQRSVEIAAEGNEQLNAALQHALTGTRNLDALLATERIEHRQLQAEFSYYAGLVHLDAGKLEAARDLVRRGLAVDGCRASLWHLLARIEFGAHQTDEALAAIDRAIALEPEHPAHRDMRNRFQQAPIMETEEGAGIDETDTGRDVAASGGWLARIVKRLASKNAALLAFGGALSASIFQLSALI